MRLYLFVILVINLFSEPAMAQADTLYFPFVAYWSAGDVYEFRVEKINNQWKNGEHTKMDTTSYDVRFEVLDSTETSYRIQWNYEMDLGGMSLPQKMARKILDDAELEVIYKTNELGEFLEVENWEEIAEHMKEFYDKVISIVSFSNGMDKDSVAMALIPKTQMFESQAGVEQGFLKELQYFHFPMGIEFDSESVLQYEDELPSLVGSGSIRADCRIRVDSFDIEQDYVVLSHEMQLYQEDTKEMLAALFEKMNILDQTKLNSLVEESIYQINDENSYAFYYFPGIPHHIHTRRSLKFYYEEEQIESLEEIIIKMKE